MRAMRTMNGTHKFQVRFRADEHETEGNGTLVVPCEVTDVLEVTIERVLHGVMQEHPMAQFDGMVYYTSGETT